MYYVMDTKNVFRVILILMSNKHSESIGGNPSVHFHMMFHYIVA